uniref:Uncharacterized protein n=1 Tax=Timema monikensis TaxID=170555 RepID=A0A7R9ENL0_9NEOP|nr:unnamed protein product [Timema monikensis]
MESVEKISPVSSSKARKKKRRLESVCISWTANISQMWACKKEFPMRSTVNETVPRLPPPIL